MKLLVLPAAELEATQAALWYDQQRSGLGDEFLAEFQSSLERVELNPGIWPRSHSYSGSRDVRFCPLRRFPYMVLFEQRTSEVVVAAVAHSRRRPLYWLDRLQ